jgi:hypothetical protein
MKPEMKKCLNLVLILLFGIPTSYSQAVNNNLWATFESSSSDQIFQKFAFDNNGKVWIDDFGKGDFFTKGDTLFVFPDKDVFKFLVEEDRFVGVSNWVQDGVWVRSGDLVDNNRLNDQEARKQAQLYDEYYTKTRVGISQFDFLFDAEMYQQYLINLESLCDRKMVKACTELFGIYSMDLDKMDLKDLSKDDPKDPKSPLRIVQKVMEFDEAEGKYLMGLYENMKEEKQKPKKNTKDQVRSFIQRTNMFFGRFFAFWLYV